MKRQTRNAAISNPSRGQRLGNQTEVRTRGHSSLATWRRRHLNTRTVVALIALSSLLAPGIAAVIEAVA